VVVEVGFAVMLEPVVALRFVDGLQEYVDAPFAVSVTDCPTQTAAGVATDTTGSGFTVTVTCVEPVHPLKSPTTVYVVVAFGLAVTEVPVVALSDVAGLHVYVLAPPAVSVVLCPTHIVEGATLMTGWLAMVTVTCAVAVHPKASPVTVYVVVEDGLAMTLDPVVELSDVDGLHV